MPSGNGNPPDKYLLLLLTGNAEQDTTTLNEYADQGYRVVPAATANPNYILLGGYKGN